MQAAGDDKAAFACFSGADGPCAVHIVQDGRVRIDICADGHVCRGGILGEDVIMLGGQIGCDIARRIVKGDFARGGGRKRNVQLLARQRLRIGGIGCQRVRGLLTVQQANMAQLRPVIACTLRAFLGKGEADFIFPGLRKGDCIALQAGFAREGLDDFTVQGDRQAVKHGQAGYAHVKGQRIARLRGDAGIQQRVGFRRARVAGIHTIAIHQPGPGSQRIGRIEGQRITKRAAQGLSAGSLGRGQRCAV